jgi:hypothetical protein
LGPGCRNRDLGHRGGPVSGLGTLCLSGAKNSVVLKSFRFPSM